jgi:hypothetical protein
MSLPVKNCETCGVEFAKHKRDSFSQWEERAFCSRACSADAGKDTPPHLRFWESAQKLDNNRCWPWTGVCDQHGYGHIHFRTRKIKAHRVSYEMHYGPIPEGNVICHVCDNPNCVNPNHLFSGTQSENMRDASRKNRLSPKSLENLRPGRAGFHGARPKSNGELKNVR